MNTKTIFIASLLTMLIVASAQPEHFALPKARVTVCIVDENYKPIGNVKAGFAFCGERNQSQVVEVEGTTDNMGTFTGEGHTYGVIGSSLTKNGYYNGSANLPGLSEAQNGRWQPWGATNTTILRKIENPVSMYAKSCWVKVSQFDKATGYDLVAGDWVAPFGNGKISDFVFSVRNNYTNFSRFDASVDLSFSNPLDGIQSTQLPKEFSCSDFIWPRIAPDSGYLPHTSLQLSLPGNPYRIEDIEKQKFFFRVRTVEKDGKIVSALYGKISEGFQLSPENAKTCGIRLSYYLNPKSLDRNMEFDLTRNLFTHLKEDEEPRSP